MNCDKALELISLRLDGLLTEDEDRALEAHLEGCDACRSLCLELTALHAAMPEEEAPPEGFLDGVMERVREEKVVPLTSTRKNKWKSWAAMAAVFALVVAGAGGLRHTFVPDGNSSGAQPETVAAQAGGDPVTAQAEAIAPTVQPDEALRYGETETGASEFAMDRQDGAKEALESVPETAPPQSGMAAGTSAPTPAPAETAEPPRQPLLGQNGADTGGGAADGAVEPSAPEVAPRVALFSAAHPEETAPAETEAVPGGVEPALTEAEQAAMERVVAYLGYEDDYTWDTPYTVVWPRRQDADTQAALFYGGVSENKGYYTFVLSNRVFGFQPEEPETFHSSLVTNLAVPVDGGDIVESAGPWYDALLSE